MRPDGHPAKETATPPDEAQERRRGATLPNGPAVAPGAGVVSPLVQPEEAGAGADMGPAGGPDGAAR